MNKNPRPKRAQKPRNTRGATRKQSRAGRRRNDRESLIQELVERGAVAIKCVVYASSKRELFNLLTTINEFEFLMEICRLAIKNLDSEPLGLPGRTAGERHRSRLIRRLISLVDTRTIERKPNETRAETPTFRASPMPDGSIVIQGMLPEEKYLVLEVHGKKVKIAFFGAPAEPLW